MANDSKSPPAQSRTPARSLEELIAANQSLLSAALLVAAAVFGVLGLWQMIQHMRTQSGLPALALWCGGMALVAMFGGLYLKWVTPMAGGPDLGSRFRLLVLGLGGTAGLLTFFLGVALPLGSWSFAFVQDPSAPKSQPMLEVWRTHWWRIMICVAAVFGGLVLMFISLQLARSVERVSVGMRRLLYGYNAVLTGLLLFAILGLFNVLAYVEMPPFSWFSKKVDWTPAQLHTLSDGSIDLLTRGVDGKVEVIALMRFEDWLAQDIQKLVANCKQYHKNISLKQYSIDATPSEFEDAVKKYGKYIPQSARQSRAWLEAGALGLIVIYTDSKDIESAGFVEYMSLVGPSKSRSAEADGGQFVFLGENLLMQTIKKLVEKEPLRIGLTKGHGELNFDGRSADPDKPAASGIKKRLMDMGYFEFSEVTLGKDGARGLEKIDVLVMAGPTEGLHPKAASDLRDFLNPVGTSKKGKLIVLMDHLRKNAGLESVLATMQVKVADARILAAKTLQPELVALEGNPDSSNPVAHSFWRDRAYLLQRAPRPVQPAGGGDGGLLVESFLETPPESDAWEEPDLVTSPLDLRTQVVAGKLKRERGKRLSAAVTVVERTPQAGMPMDPRHANVPRNQVPRMVVFGDAGWISDTAVNGPGGRTNVILLYNCLTWLGGRTGLGADIAEPKERSEMTLVQKVQPSQANRVKYLPLALMLLTVVALGGGIWVALVVDAPARDGSDHSQRGFP